MVVWCTQNAPRLTLSGSRLLWHQPCQRCKYTTSVDIQKRAIKTVHSCRITCERSESARERRIALYKKRLIIITCKFVTPNSMTEFPLVTVITCKFVTPNSVTGFPLVTVITCKFVTPNSVTGFPLATVVEHHCYVDCASHSY